MQKERRLESLPEDWETALAFAAHPDDLEFGSTSAIAGWTSLGKKVSYLLFTRGEAGIDSMPPAKAARLRDEEERRSVAAVGVRAVEFLDYPDGVIEYSLILRRDIARAIRKHRPNVLVTVNHRVTFQGARLNMGDHRWVGLAVLDATRDAGIRWIFPELLEENLERWNGVKMVCMNGSPEPTHAVDVTSFLDKGIFSLKEHRVYIENLQGFNPESFLRKNATEAGKRFGCRFAVEFEVIWV